MSLSLFQALALKQAVDAQNTQGISQAQAINTVAPTGNKTNTALLSTQQQAINNAIVSGDREALQRAQRIDTTQQTTGGKILSGVVDVAKLGIQGVSMIGTALNGGKDIWGGAMDTKTGLFSEVDKVIDKVDDLGHIVGATFVKGITGGAVDLSTQGIFEKGGLEKVIDEEKAIAELGNYASSEQGQETLGNLGGELGEYATNLTANLQEQFQNFGGNLTEQITNAFNNLNTNGGMGGNNEGLNNLISSLNNNTENNNAMFENLTNSLSSLVDTAQSNATVQQILGGSQNLLPGQLPTNGGVAGPIVVQSKDGTVVMTNPTKIDPATGQPIPATEPSLWEKIIAWFKKKKTESPTLFWTIVTAPIWLPLLIWGIVVVFKKIFKKGSSKKF